MGLIARDTGGGDFEPVPHGVHVAVCNLVADLGIQASGKFKPRQSVYIRWEIPSCRIRWVGADMNEHEGPHQIGRRYTLSLARSANLRADLEAWRGKPFTAVELVGFDLFKVLGTACQMSIGHEVGDDKRTYAKIMAIMALPRGAPRPAAESAPIRYSAENPEQFERLPEWIKNTINEQLPDPTETMAPSTQRTAPDFDDDIPF